MDATVTQQINEQQSQEQLGRGMRQKIPSVKLRDYVTHTIFTNSPSPSPNTSSPQTVILSIISPIIKVILTTINIL